MNYFGDFCSAFRRRANAVAFVDGSEEYNGIRGRVLFYEHDGGVIVSAEFFGLPDGSKPCGNPIFGFHIHDGAKCEGNEEDLFADAGGHYNPAGCEHPYHAGDLPPLFGVDGGAFSAFLTNRFSVTDIIGKTIVLHLSPDDFISQPAGNAGEKIACGIITSTAR